MTSSRRIQGLGLSLGVLIMMCGCGKPPLGPGQTYTLSGVVTEVTPSGVAPVPDVLVEDVAGLRSTHTDKTGQYPISGLPNGSATVRISRWQFEVASQSVTISGKTVADFRIARRSLHTLSGFVTEETGSGRIPVEGVWLGVVLCPPQEGQKYTLVDAVSDEKGFYSIPNLCDGETAMFPWKEGYEIAPAANVSNCEGDGAECRSLTIAGETQFDVQMVKR